MPDLIDTLYNYVQENRVIQYLQSPEYRQAIYDIEDHWDAFRATLTPEQAQKLDGLLEEKAAAAYLEDRAAFCAAVSIGLTLGRL